MADPTVVAEIEFSAGAWTNVSAYLRAAKTERGRQRALDTVDPGTMVLTLANADRRFDPEHATGPYYGNLRPGKRARLRATWNAVTYDIFTGYLDRLTQGYDAPNDAVAVFECSDGLAVLAAATLGSPFTVTMAGFTPRTWLRLGESGGPAAYDRSGNAHHAGFAGSPTFRVDGLLDGDPDGAVTFPTVNAGYMVLGPGTLPTASSWTLSFLFYMPAAPAAGVTQYVMYDARAPLGLKVYVGSTGRMAVEVTKDDGTQGAIAATSSAVANGTPYQINIVASAGQTLKIYNGDTDLTTSASGTNHSLASSSASYTVVGLSDSQPTTLDEFLTFDSALTTADLFDLGFAVGGWVHDAGSARVGRVLDAVGWPAAERNITSEWDGFLKATELGTSALDHLRQLSDTIEGRLWIKPNGTLKLLGRNAHLEAPYATSQATFGDNPGELGYVDMGSYSLDWDLVTNVVRRTNGDSVVTAADASSISAYGLRDQTDAADVESQFLTLDYEYDLAAFRVEHYAEPVAFVDGLRIEPRADPTNLWPQVLGRDLGDRITFKRRPQGVGSAISTETIVEGIAHTIGPKRWTTELSIDAIGAQRYFRFDNTTWNDTAGWRFAA